MELKQLTDRVWYYPYEQERDRPNLGYIRGDSFSVAVDAGHSQAHTEEFYDALKKAGLPLPELTIITHWHWDHTFGMHSVHGLCIANSLTNGHLRKFSEKIKDKEEEKFFSLHESIRLEYANSPVIVTLADMVFSGEMLIDAGNCPVRIFQAQAPHTDDSSLIHVINDNVLFLGDAAGGVFPTWERDPALCRTLAETIRGINADICLEGHYIPQTTQETVDDLLTE